jgi:hypothetical protein
MEIGNEGMVIPIIISLELQVRGKTYLSMQL